MTEAWTQRRVAVLGAARTGVAVARALAPRGALVHVFDGKSEDALADAARALRAAGATFTMGAEDGPEMRAADVIVPSPGVWKTHPTLTAAAARGQTIWSEPEVAYRLAQAPLLAVTGTNGKTTTTALLGAMLADAGRDARVGGNIAPGRPLIEIAAEAPASAVLVAEISSFQLEWIEAFRPLAGILTNVTPDHLDRHGSMEEYAAVKARLFENQTGAEHAIVNADNARALTAGRNTRATLWTWSLRGPVERGAFLRDGVMVWRDGDRETAIGPAAAIRLPGAHNVENALAAATAAKIMGLDADNILHTLTRFEGVGHRLEPVACRDGVEYVNNSMCTNPAALASSLRAYDRPVVLIAGGRNKGLDFSELPPVMKERCRAVFTIGEFGPALAEMARAAGVPEARHAVSLDRAVAMARAVAHAGDVVLLAPGCASMDQFRSFEDRGQQFTEMVLSPAPDGAHEGLGGAEQ